VKEAIHTTRAPAAVGPYSQAVKAGSLLCLSGQIALDPATAELVDGPFEAQARQVFDNLQAVLREAGGELADIVRLQLILTDMDHFPTLNEVMKGYFSPPYPARSCLAAAALPKGAALMAEALAVLPAGPADPAGQSAVGG